ncbi:hypothetical protein Bhyg_02435 [Pseudolycoriella hygida]|uniref:F-box domain-containing protein n=1 Tax=Pseudolycoriella hygida TaxID=35572 RepID=A0A9Q0S6M8_9DIPT|nr:hypothetical protein Bhyg_02435 [Pseudolycoriella hygida]
MARQMECSRATDSIIDENNLSEAFTDSGYASHGNLSNVTPIKKCVYPNSRSKENRRLIDEIHVDELNEPVELIGVLTRFPLRVSTPISFTGSLKQRTVAIKPAVTGNEPFNAKVPLFDLSSLVPKPKCVAPKRHFDILSNLSTLTTATEKIFNYLEPKDINSVHNVCSSWRSIVKNSQLAYKARNKYLNAAMNYKENSRRKPPLMQRSISAIKLSSLKCHNFNVMNGKPPLRRASTQVRVNDEQSPINENQRFTKCSSCGRPSIIHEKKNDDEFKNYIPFHSSNFKYGFLRDFAKSNESRYEYAECFTCQFKFCMNCNCEFHGNKECPVRRFVGSEDSDDEDGNKVIYSTGSRSSKHNLKRLCKLDKVKFSSIG